MKDVKCSSSRDHDTNRSLYITPTQAVSNRRSVLQSVLYESRIAHLSRLAIGLHVKMIRLGVVITVSTILELSHLTTRDRGRACLIKQVMPALSMLQVLLSESHFIMKVERDKGNALMSTREVDA